MQKFKCIKEVIAKPMSRLAYNEYRGWDLPKDECGEDPGYLVEYLDGGEANHPDHEGYISWSPKKVFDKGYILLNNLDSEMEKEIQEKGLTAFRLSNEYVTERLSEVQYYVHQIPDTTTIQVTAFFRGFSLCTESMACISPENFNYELGEKYGIEKCEKAAKDKLWNLLGFFAKFKGELL